ncbi:MAG: entericidin A/B family lipoprotein [Pseudomonadota bacterium]
MNTVKTVALMIILAAAAACNTVDGAGQDISAGGEAISDAAQDVQEEL